jgi:hypothetical protein
MVRGPRTYIENPAYASNFITSSQEEKFTNEITGFSCDVIGLCLFL